MTDDRPMLTERLRQSVVFVSAWMTIVLVAVYDDFMLVINRAVIVEAEMNPLGRWLIAANGGEVWLFVLMKLIGTVVVSTTLLFCYWRNRRLGLLVCIAIATMQLALLVVLLM